MTTEKPSPGEQSPSALDDVRRVRERLSAEFGGDIRRLAEHAQRVAEQHQASLRVKVVLPPITTK